VGSIPTSAVCSNRKRRPRTRHCGLIRGRLEGLGPVTAAQLGEPLGLPARSSQAWRWLRSRPRVLRCAADSRLMLRGSNGASVDYWHAYIATRSSGCARIEPVQARTFAFLFDWQRVLPGRGCRVGSVAAVLKSSRASRRRRAVRERHPAARIANTIRMAGRALSGRPLRWARLQARRAIRIWPPADP